MTAFQIIGITFCALAISFTWFAGKRLTRRSTLLWNLLWLGAAVTIAFPQMTVVMARSLGISRGADLVFYSAILAMIVGYFVIFVRLRRIEMSLTQLARRIAIDGAAHPGSSPEDRSGEGDP